MTQEETNHSAIDNLLSRILEGSASNQDILQFSEWIKDYQNEVYFDRFKDVARFCGCILQII